MHDVLRQRLLRKIESLPDEQIYQVLDYIEFLESKYSSLQGVEASGLQKFAEGLEDKLRRRAVSPSTIREAFQLISAADRVLSGVSSAGRQILEELGQVIEVPAQAETHAEKGSPGPDLRGSGEAGSYDDGDGCGERVPESAGPPESPARRRHGDVSRRVEADPRKARPGR
jgi:hypothetical protein